MPRSAWLPDHHLPLRRQGFVGPDLRQVSEHLREGRMTFAVGSLVKARGREWVVLPDSADDLLVVRPLGGSDAEITGLYLPLESVSEAHFDLPDARDLGDY